MAYWLSWLERRPVTAEVTGSSPVWVVRSERITLTISNAWDLSSAGRASALQAEGHRFEPYRSHFYGGIAQLARAHGSYPWCRGFKSPFRYFFMPGIPVTFQKMHECIFFYAKNRAEEKLRNVTFCNIMGVEKGKHHSFLLFFCNTMSENVTNNRNLLQKCFKYF